jgi:hypothetical protein
MLWAAALSRSGVDVMTGAAPGWSGLQGLAGWLWVVAIVGLAESLMARRQRRSPSTAALPAARLESRWRRAAGYANQAVLPFYLLHEPVIVAAAWVIVRWRAPIPMKYAVLVVVSFAGTLLLYDVLVRRLRVTRLLFGMRALATPQA